MTYEVELKYPLTDEASFRLRLGELKAQPRKTITQEDEYLNHPSRDFAQSDEALRIRRIDHDNRLTFKGPLVDSETKTREEIEIAFAEGAEEARRMRTLLERLGFRPVYRVCKIREIFVLSTESREFEIVIDQVEGLGKYVELECGAGEQDLTQARQEILELAALLGLGPQVERRSYLRLLLARQAEGKSSLDQVRAG